MYTVERGRYNLCVGLSSSLLEEAENIWRFADTTSNKVMAPRGSTTTGRIRIMYVLEMQLLVCPLEEWNAMRRICSANAAEWWLSG
jgi:SH3-like domain-containing protein